MDKKKGPKERAYNDFMSMIRESWTYARLDETERKRLKYGLLEANEKFARGDYRSRTNMLHAAYICFLASLGYEDWEALGVEHARWRI